MSKISITGPKKELKPVIDTLHELEVLDLEDYQGELEKGSPFEEAEELSQTLVDIRSLLSKIPDTETEEDQEVDLNEIQDNLYDIESTVDELNTQKNEFKDEVKNVKEQIKFFNRVKGCKLKYEDLKGSKELETFIGKIKTSKFREEVDSTDYDIFEGHDATIIVYSRKISDEVNNAIGKYSRKEFEVPNLGNGGSIPQILTRLKDKKNNIKLKEQKAEEELQDVSDKWLGKLKSAEEYLTERVEKAEAPINFATTEKTFIAQGWIPSKDYERLEEVLAAATDGKIHIQKEEGENPPVKHDNPAPVKSFESLTDLMSVPSYNELDPSIVILLTFPLLFGFMIGDAGYGLTSFIVFLGGAKLFPKAKDIFKSLMWASGFTFLFGLFFGEIFGFKYSFFGSHSKLAEMTGIGLFKVLPTFHKGHATYQIMGSEISSWTIIFGASALIGLIHVNFGYLLGLYNEYNKHGIVEAFLEKGSWLLLEIGIALLYFVGTMVGAPVIIVSIALLYKGEGIEGVVEIPSLLSNVLSYLRLFGVSVAAFSLAKVVNALAAPLFDLGGVLGLVLGVALLVFGHTFNTFIKIIEGFLQGIRLHYVEMFSKFFEGGGRKYLPFGADR